MKRTVGHGPPKSTKPLPGSGLSGMTNGEARRVSCSSQESTGGLVLSDILGSVRIGIWTQPQEPGDPAWVSCVNRKNIHCSCYDVLTILLVWLRVHFEDGKDLDQTGRGWYPSGKIIFA